MKAFLVLCIFGFSFSLAAADKVLNGGDNIGLEFHESFAAAIKKAEGRAPDLARELEAAGLTQALAVARVIVVDEPLRIRIAGKLQDSVAANERESQTIYVNRAKWQSLDDQILREAIAIHEVASLKGLETTGSYSLSSRYLIAFDRRAGDILGAANAVAMARGQFSAGIELKAVKCSGLEKFVSIDDQKKWASLSFEEGAQINWIQGAKRFTLSFLDSDSDMFRDKLIVSQRSKEVLERDGQGRETKSEGFYKSHIFTTDTINSGGGVFTRAAQWISDSESVVSTTIDGASGGGTARTQEMNLAPGQELVVTDTRPEASIEEEGKIIQYESSFLSCAYDRVPMEKMPEFLEPKMIEAVKVIDRVMRGADLARAAESACAQAGGDCSIQKEMLRLAETERDLRWKEAIQPRSFDLRRQREIRRPSTPVRHRRVVERTAWKRGPGYDVDATNRRLDELIQREKRRNEIDRINRNLERIGDRLSPWPGTGYIDHNRNPVYRTPWGFRSHTGFPVRPGAVWLMDGSRL